MKAGRFAPGLEAAVPSIVSSKQRIQQGLLVLRTPAETALFLSFSCVCPSLSW
jgi:hypothetical protein